MDHIRATEPFEGVAFCAPVPCRRCHIVQRMSRSLFRLDRAFARDACRTRGEWSARFASSLDLRHVVIETASCSEDLTKFGSAIAAQRRYGTARMPSGPRQEAERLSQTPGDLPIWVARKSDSSNQRATPLCAVRAGHGTGDLASFDLVSTSSTTGPARPTA